MAHPLTVYITDNKVSREALAKAAGTTRQTIHRIEKGEQTPSLDLVGRLIAACDRKISADDFLMMRKAI